MIDGQLLRARHKASEATSGSEEVGRVGEWAAVEGWGDKGLVCKCNAMTFQSLERKKLTCSKKKKIALLQKQATTDTTVVLENTLENLLTLMSHQE